MSTKVAASKLLINGLVQGVGFRPTICKIAAQLQLSGWVKNTSYGVEVVITPPENQAFIRSLEDSLPLIASLDSIEQIPIELSCAVNGFKIAPSTTGGFNDTVMPPDNYVCSECLQDLFNPFSRYFLHPFTNCTNCGPRYTVIKGLPYDREQTALADFPLCSECNQEYNDPHNRRFHAQATSCRECGPKYAHDLAVVAEQIRAGKIVALKGVGGYVLLADASNPAVVATLRERKKRPDKPFALMALNTVSIQHFLAHVSEHEAGILESAAAPILILNRKVKSKVAPNVAPDLATLGCMLPSSPVFYILFYHLLGQPTDKAWLQEAHDLAVLATSANFSGGTIISSEAEAEAQLLNIADCIVSFNRDIIIKCDDSVILASGDHDVILRRARGLAPKPYYFPYSMPQVLGLGANLKNTLTYIRGNKAYMSQYLGDMNSEHTINYFKQVIAHYTHIFKFEPELVLSDLHPDFFVGQFAEQLGIRHLRLQHHFAHLAAVIANAEGCGKKIQPVVLGCILDGYGYGLDGGAWGGELIKFQREQLDFEVVSHLPAIPLPGGDIAEREPWRMALALCQQNDLPLPEHLLEQKQAALLIQLLQGPNIHVSRGFGRMFSAVAALLNIKTHSSYEAHAVLALESLVRIPEIDHDYARMTKHGVPDCNLLWQRVYQVGIVEKNINRAVNIFYGSIAALIEKWIIFHCSVRNIRMVAVAGGCWQSRYLLTSLSAKFRQLGIELLVPYQMPLNDESVSLGQAWYGAQTLMLTKNTLSQE